MLGGMTKVCLTLLGTARVFSKLIPCFAYPQARHDESFSYYTFAPTLDIVSLLHFSLDSECQQSFILVSMCISQLPNGVECLFMCLFDIHLL